MKGKPEKIDVLNLYAKSDHKEWNSFLTRSYLKRDLATLEKVLYGLQRGMNDLANKKLNSDKINIWFVRMQRSIENTIKKIIKEKLAHPLDNPLNSKMNVEVDSKRKRDEDIEKHLRKVRF